MLFIIYLLVGCLLAACCKLENDKPLYKEPSNFMLVALVWPVFIIVMAPKVSKITRNGKVIWQKKDHK